MLFLCPTHTHTTHTSHTHTHTLTHPHSLTHPVCSLSHLPGPAAAVVSVSVSCNSRSVVLPCPALPCLALPRPALPATRSTRARCQPAPVAARPPTGHRTVPYRTPPPGTPGTPHDTTRNYSKLLPTTTSLTHSLSALTGHWHATAHRRRAPLVSPCDIATCNALSIPEPRASSTARPSDPSRHPSNPVLGHFPIRNTPRIITRKGIDRTHSTRLTIPASATTAPTTFTTSITTTTTTSPATDLPTSRHRPRLPLHLPDRHLCVRGGRGDIRWHHEGGFSGLGRGEEKHRHALCAGVTGVYMKY